MRLIRRLVLLTIIGAGAVAAYNWSDGWPLRARPAAEVKKGAVTLANKAAVKASAAATKVGGTVSAGAR